jgi:tRNA modification GTPase
VSSFLQTSDTVAAIASAPGSASRGIVRISGPTTLAVLSNCVAGDDVKRLAAVCEPTALAVELVLSKPQACKLSATIYFWPDERSYTRQPAAEIHTTGSPALLAAVLSTVCENGARLAQPGEFTLRAFLAGRLDMTQAEAVLGVIDARGDDDLRHALAQLAGGLARPLHRLRNTLLDLLAHLEAGLDFVEEDIEFVTRSELANQLQAAEADIQAALQQLASRKTDCSLARVALLGWPNVGKSSLFNALSGGQALVSETPGTTRDYLTAEVELGGELRCLLIDTAGHEAIVPPDLVPQQAQRHTLEQTLHCDVEVLCLDCTRELNAWELGRLAEPAATARIIAWTKSDLHPAGVFARLTSPAPVVPTTARHEMGLAHLRTAIRFALAELNHEAGFSTAERCAGSMRAAASGIAAARELCMVGGDEELIAVELRLALDQLGQVVGAVYTEDILDRVFSRFCIGK